MKRVSTEAALERAETRLGHPRHSNGYLRFSECPSCGHSRTAAFWISDDGEGYARARCFKCQLGTRDALELLGLLDGREYAPRPEWTPPPVPSVEERRRKVERRYALALTSSRIEVALAHAAAHLLWDAATMRRLGTGELDGRIVLPVRTDDGELLGITEYAMPGSTARARVEATGGTKLVAHGRRSLWPRPLDVPDGVHLSERLLLVEGPAAAATALGCGFAAVSYPNAAGLSELDAERIVRRATGDAARRARRVVVLGDCDKKGREGMDATVLRLRELGVETVGIDLDPDRDDGYDAADYLRDLHNRAHDPLAAGARLAQEIEGVM